ncbi:N-acetylneuraminate epimerase precursor [Maliponia aquimaris]|uniref:N-acetylneuraminate epimerase n=2 Tax=Maliponia aquimaris TaxID=1673631 RepID=A0A238L1Y9_9RHOB|nr:N-acetylneuraminate epimerase precursor [Maliponia aquimaris]
MVTMMTSGMALAEGWPDLPVGIKNGIATRVDNRVIVGLGTAGADIFALDLDDRGAGWKKLSPFTGAVPSQPAVAVSNGAIYVFGGSGKASADAAAPIVFDTVWRYDAAADSWQELDTATPAGLLGASAMTMPDGRIAVIGGYNKDQFDSYLAEITAIDKEKSPDQWAKVVQDFMGRKPEAYQWNKMVLVYDPVANIWGDLGANPYLPNTGSAVVETAPGSFDVINGEVKPGLRTTEVKSLTFDADGADWQPLAPLPGAEGVAGAYAGLANGQVLVAGGANFQGARARAEAGHWFAHEGLTKHWASEVHVLSPDGWQQVGTLSEGLAYGGSVTLDEGVLLIGGEDATGTARSEVFLLGWDGTTLSRQD